MVIAPTKGEAMQATIATLFPDDHFRMGNEAWLLHVAGLTTQQISAKLEIIDGDAAGRNAPAVVFALGKGYWGNYNRSLWEFIKVKLESPNG